MTCFSFCLLNKPRYRSILQLVKPWYDEVKDYAFPYPQDCNPRCPMRCYGPMCTHYTQVIWITFFYSKSSVQSWTFLWCIYNSLSNKCVYIYIYFCSIWTSPIINIYSDGLGHFQSYRLRNPHMPQYERLGICLATSCLLGMQLCPKVSCFLLILFIFILHACFGPLIGLLTPFSAAWPVLVLFLRAAPSF